jgi:hypothetical protein
MAELEGLSKKPFPEILRVADKVARRLLEAYAKPPVDPVQMFD